MQKWSLLWGCWDPGIPAQSGLLFFIPPFFMDPSLQRLGTQQWVAMGSLTFSCNWGGRESLSHRLSPGNLSESGARTCSSVDQSSWLGCQHWAVPRPRCVLTPVGLLPDVGRGVGQTNPQSVRGFLWEFQEKCGLSGQKDAHRCRCLHVVPKAYLTPPRPPAESRAVENQDSGTRQAQALLLDMGGTLGSQPSPAFAFFRPTRCCSVGGSSPPRRRAAGDLCPRSSGQPHSARRSCCGSRRWPPAAPW